jgi:hypothetical protein
LKTNAIPVFKNSKEDLRSARLGQDGTKHTSIYQCCMPAGEFRCSASLLPSDYQSSYNCDWSVAARRYRCPSAPNVKHLLRANSWSYRTRRRINTNGMRMRCGRCMMSYAIPRVLEPAAPAVVARLCASMQVARKSWCRRCRMLLLALAHDAAWSSVQCDNQAACHRRLHSEPRSWP